MRDRVLVCGGSGGEAWLAARAWRASGVRVGVYCDDPTVGASRARALGVEPVTDRAALFDDPTVGTLHLLEGVYDRDRTLQALLLQGRDVLCASPFCQRPEQAESLFGAVERGPGRLRDASPLPWLPALREGLRRAQANQVGRLQQARFRSYLAGLGGWDAGANPACPLRDQPPTLPVEALLLRELGEVLPIAEGLLGPVVEIQVQAPRREPPCCAIASWRHRDHARHGALELTTSPCLTLPSPFQPREDSVEITGSAGILWVGGLHGGPGTVPPLRLYRGDTLIQPEPPRGGWPAAWEAMVQAAGSPSSAQLRHRAACLTAAARALETGERVGVE
ncbi:MAG: hypothetical protein ABIO70_12605 [Pseudomonadota bacterium]